LLLTLTASRERYNLQSCTAATVSPRVPISAESLACFVLRFRWSTFHAFILNMHLSNGFGGLDLIRVAFLLLPLSVQDRADQQSPDIKARSLWQKLQRCFWDTEVLWYTRVIPDD
jgi:hypothetical protein